MAVEHGDATLHGQDRRLDELSLRSTRALRHRLTAARRRLESYAAHLSSLSPLGVLGRGYSLTHRLSDGLLICDAALLSPGEELSTRFATGRTVSRIESVESDSR